jgi:hypothetical protein
MHKLVSRFFFARKRRKEKANKKNRRKGVSPSADGEEGCAPSTAPPFEKGGRKLLLE